MKKLYFVAIFLIMTAGIFFILKYGMKPQPVGIMKPSFFSQPEEIGAVVYRRFYAPIEQYKVVVVGIPPQPAWHAEIIRGMIKAAAVEHHAFDVLVEEEEMMPLELNGLPPIEVVKTRMNTDTQAEFVDLLAKYKKEGKRVLVHTASIFSSQLLYDNPVTRYEKTTGEALFTITTGPLALRADQEYLIDPPCVGSQRDQSGTSDLGCHFLSAGRGFYRKKVEQDRYVAVMNQHAPALDYYLMISWPGQDKGTDAANTALRSKAPMAFGTRAMPDAPDLPRPTATP